LSEFFSKLKQGSKRILPCFFLHFKSAFKRKKKKKIALVEIIAPGMLQLVHINK
jgi:predicted SnoaL-like aldol condensation-catalyzing enzyme